MAIAVLRMGLGSVSMDCARSLDNVICGLVVVAIFLLQASWLTSIFSFFKIVGRCGRRRAAKSRAWVLNGFYIRLQSPGPIALGLLHRGFRAGQLFEERLFLGLSTRLGRSQLAKNAQEHPHGMYYLPHMSSDAGSASATYAANHSTNHA